MNDFPVRFVTAAHRLAVQERTNPMTSKDTDAQARLPRVVVDLKIPLWGLASAAAVVLWGLVSMYFTLATVSSKVDELQATVKVANSNFNQIVSEQALIKYRVEKLEAERAHQAPGR